MSRLLPEKLHVRFEASATPLGPVMPRRYTLTHSDASGELFLTIGPDYDQRQIAGWYTRLMRDEVLAEWQASEAGPALHVYCHVSGGLVLGSARLRYEIFQRELPLVLGAVRWGDRQFFAGQPQLDGAAIWVHWRSTNRRYQSVERWGRPADYVPSVPAENG